MRILTAAAMRRAEADAVARGTSYRQLMERAGTGAAHAIVQLAQRRGLAHSAVFLCGRGNNAGDAYVAARVLAGCGWRCQLVSLCPGPLSELAAENLAALPPTCEVVKQADYTAPVLVDGVFGTGFRGPLPAEVAAAFAAANAADAVRVALDLPSGLDPDTGEVLPGCFRARATLTFGAYKPGLLEPQAAGFVGEVTCIDIGLWEA